MAEATERAMVTSHENGKLYLAFNKNNAHVNKKEYRLNEDVYGLFYVTDYGQLIIASYTKQGIRALENDLKKTCLLYTSDAADEEDSVDLGGRRIIKKKKKKKKKK